MEKVQRSRGPKSLFITEYDTVFKEEEPETVVPVEPVKKGQKKKSSMKEVEEEWKMYPHHKYAFASVGRHQAPEPIK